MASDGDQEIIKPIPLPMIPESELQSRLLSESEPRPTSCGPVESGVSPTCRICDVDKPQSQEVTFHPCEHTICLECLRDYLAISIGEHHLKILCPTFKCESEISETLIRAVTTPDLFSKLQRFRKAEELERNPLLRWCPRADCDGYDVQTEGKEGLKCNLCGYRYCYQCGEAYHGDTSCQNPEDGVVPSIKFCPKCRVKVERAEGCSHMQCPRCHYEWCWLCGKPYFSMHFMTCDVMRAEFRNPSNDVILLFMFLPFVAVLFVILLAALWLSELIRTNRKLSVWIQNRKWIFPVVVLLSIALFPTIAVIGCLISGIAVMYDLGEYLRANPRLFSSLARRERLWTFMTVVLGLVLSPLLIIATGVVVTIGPLIATGLILVKCCNKNPRPVEVKDPIPGYRLGEV